MNAQSVAALSVSVPSGSRESEPGTVFESATEAPSAVPSTRSYVCPPIVAATISPSYESASSSVPVAVSISATPSGAPFWASTPTERYAPGRERPGELHALVLGAVAPVHEDERETVQDD